MQDQKYQGQRRELRLTGDSGIINRRAYTHGILGSYEVAYKEIIKLSDEWGITSGYRNLRIDDVAL